MSYDTTYSLYDHEGQRKYLNYEERRRFFECAKSFREDIKLFCWMVLLTGGRISEVHRLHVRNLDFSNRSVVIETLKKRKKREFRELPLPDFFLNLLLFYLGHNRNDLPRNMKLWWFSIRSASRYIKSVMNKAGIEGPKSTARGLRHGFAVESITGVHITQVKKWLGHAELETTEIYLNVMGREERVLIARTWEGMCA